MLIDIFETQIESVIVERGYDYFEEDSVENLNEGSKGNWSATVIGSEEYEVSVSINNKEITGWECDCPYEHGPICKHVTAVLFAIRANVAENAEFEVIKDAIEIAPDKTKEKNHNNKKPTKSKNEIADLLQKLSTDELKTFLIEQIQENTELKNAFLSSFAEKQEGDSFAKYVKLIMSIAGNIAGKHGFIDYRGASKLTLQIMGLCGKASQLLAKGNLTESLAITKAIIEVLPEIVAGMDDSDGGATDIWETAFENFRQIIEKVPPMLKDELFDYCLAQYPKEKYRDFGFESSFLDFLPDLIKTSDQEKQFFEVIDKQIEKEKQEKYREHAISNLLLAKIRYLNNSNKQAEAHYIINQHAHISDFRDILLEKALVNNNYNEAKKICKDGIKIAENMHHPGTVIRYTDKLLEIAEKEQNLPEIKILSEKLFFENHYNLGYYRKLKQYWEPGEWPNKCEEIINKIIKETTHGSYNDANTIAKLFVEEQYFDRLLKLLQINDLRLNFIDEFSKYLSNLYPDEIIQLYEKAITHYADGTGRGVYEDVARYLKKLSKIPGGTIVTARLLNNFRDKYRNRRAMLEVLDKHFK